MLDISKLPPHIQEAIKLTEMDDLSRRRVRRGIELLDRIAPVDWRLQMMSIRKGIVYSHIRVGHHTENPLSLAFRGDFRFVEPDGRLRFSSARRLLDHNPLEADKISKLCGFIGYPHFASNLATIPEIIDNDYLDQAWANALGELDWHDAVTVRRHVA